MTTEKTTSDNSLIGTGPFLVGGAISFWCGAAGLAGDGLLFSWNLALACAGLALLSAGVVLCMKTRPVSGSLLYSTANIAWMLAIVAFVHGEGSEGRILGQAAVCLLAAVYGVSGFIAWCHQQKAVVGSVASASEAVAGR